MKRRKNCYIFLCLIVLEVFSSCRHVQKPDNVMDTVTLRQFLREAHLIDSYNEVVVGRKGDSLGFQVDAAYDSLLAKYHVTSADYDSTLAYYAVHHKEFMEVYRRVSDDLKRTADSLPLLHINTNPAQLDMLRKAQSAQTDSATAKTVSP